MKNKVRTPKKKKKNILIIFIKNIIKLIDKSIVLPTTKFFVAINEKFSKKNGRIEKWLTRKNTMIFTSLLIALLLFFYVDYKNVIPIDSSVEVLRNQKVVAVYNEEAYVVEGLPETADVTLIGKGTSDLYLARQLSNGTVSVDISNLKPGTHTIDLSYTSSIKSVNYMINPSKITIVIYPKMSLTKSATIDVINADKLNSRLFVNDVSIDQEEIFIKGSEDVVNSVATIKALVDINKIVKPTEGINELSDVNLIAYDSEGNVVEVEIVPNKVNAKVSISSSSVTVPLKVVPKNSESIQFGKAISSINTDISQITVYGDSEALENLKYVPVEIDVSGMSSTKSFNVTIPKPDGIKEMSAESVNVTISLGAVNEKTIKNVQIENINLDSNYSVQAVGQNSSVTNVIVKGTDTVLENIDASMIKATVDLAGLGEGEHVVPVNIAGEDLKATYTANPTKITVKIFKK